MHILPPHTHPSGSSSKGSTTKKIAPFMPPMSSMVTLSDSAPMKSALTVSITASALSTVGGLRNGAGTTNSIISGKDQSLPPPFSVRVVIPDLFIASHVCSQPPRANPTRTADESSPTSIPNPTCNHLQSCTRYPKQSFSPASCHYLNPRPRKGDPSKCSI